MIHLNEEKFSSILRKLPLDDYEKRTFNLKTFLNSLKNGHLQ